MSTSKPCVLLQDPSVYLVLNSHQINDLSCYCYSIIFYLFSIVTAKNAFFSPPARTLTA